MYGNHDDEFRIIIDNNDDSPLNIDDVKMSYAIDRLVFKAEGDQEYRLITGNDDVSAPIYDIVSYKQLIEDDVKELVLFGETFVKKMSEIDPSSEFDTKIILNMIVIMTSLFLIVIIIRSIKNE